MDDEFSSGPWSGFYTYWNNARGRMDLSLSFKEGVVTGTGSDPVGDFTLRGRHSADTGEVHWTKTYRGAHDVFYKGYRDARGIWGTWEMPGDWKGGFHIWPEGQGEGASRHAEAEIDAPAAGSPRGR